MSSLDDGGDGARLTKTGMIFGTPEYMSPEQAIGRPPDHRVDIYAMGVIAFEMFAGRVPFVGDSFMAILTQHMTAQPPEIGELNPNTDCPPALEAVIRRAMSKDPNDRQSSMAELAQQIIGAVEGSLPGMQYPTGLLHPPIERPPTQVPRIPTQTPGDVRAIAKTAALPGTAPPTFAAPAGTMPGTDTSPSAPASGGSRGLVVGVGAVVLLAAAGAAAWFAFLRPPTTVDTPDAGIAVTSPPDAAVVAASPPDAAIATNETDAGPPPEAIDAGSTDVAASMDASTTTNNVQVAITSTPSGAEVRVAGRGIVCASTPCFFETARGRTIALSLFSRRMEAEQSITPNENSAFHIRLRRAQADGADAGRRAVRDAAVRAGPRDGGRRVRPGCIEGLRCPDFGL